MNYLNFVLQNLADNRVGCTGVKIFSSVLSSNTQLQHLNLSNNLLSDDDASLLGTALGVCACTYKQQEA